MAADSVAVVLAYHLGDNFQDIMSETAEVFHPQGHTCHNLAQMAVEGKEAKPYNYSCQVVDLKNPDRAVVEHEKVLVEEAAAWH